MSQKETRGSKRTCHSCSSRFYDLNRDPIVCPVCQTPFVLTASEVAANAVEAAKPKLVKAPVKKEAFVPAEVLPDGLELPEMESTEALAEIEAEDTEIAGDEVAEDTFLEEEGEGDDVAGLVEGPAEGEEEI